MFCACCEVSSYLAEPKMRFSNIQLFCPIIFFCIFNGFNILEELTELSYNQSNIGYWKFLSVCQSESALGCNGYDAWLIIRKLGG